MKNLGLIAAIAGLFALHSGIFNSAWADGWYKLKEENGICVVANDNILMGITEADAQIELRMYGMRRIDGNRDIWVDNVHIGRTIYLGNGELTLENYVTGPVLVAAFIKGYKVGSKWKSKSLMGFTSAYSQCSFARRNDVSSSQSADISPVNPAIQSSPETAIVDQRTNTSCGDGPIETQARCSCETQGFKMGSQEFLVCFQSVVGRLNQEHNAVIQDQQKRQTEFDSAVQRQQQAELERQQRQKAAVGSFLRNLGAAIATGGQATPPRPTINCTHMRVGQTVQTNCF